MTLRVTGAVIMFVFSLGLCIGSNIYVSSALSELYQLTEEYEDITDDKADALSEKWQDKRTALSVFLKHTEADMLERFFAEIENYSVEEKNGKKKTADTVGELRAFLSVIIETEKAKIENIF